MTVCIVATPVLSDAQVGILWDQFVYAMNHPEVEVCVMLAGWTRGIPEYIKLPAGDLCAWREMAKGK